MAFIENPSTQFQSLKRPDPLLHEGASSAQEAIEIRRVSPGGMFEIGQDRYSKTFEINDINYSNKGYQEQVLFFDSWAKTLNAFSVPFKITVFNRRRSLKTLNEKILYKMQGDAYDEARECYNDVMRSKIIDDKQGIEQKKYLTVILDKKGGCREAEKAMVSLEASCIKEYAGFGCQLTPLSGNERLNLLRSFYRGDDEQTVSIEGCIETGSDWRNEVCPDYIDWTKAHPRHIEMNGKYIRTMYIDPHSYGETVEDKFFRELSDLSAESIFTLDIIPIPKSVTQKVLENKYMGVESMISKQQQKRNKQKNFSSEISYRLRREKEEIEEMLDAVRKNDQKQFWVGISIAVCAGTMEELDRLTSTVEQICAGNSCKLNIYMQLQREGLNTVLPIGVRNSSFLRAMFTQSAASFIPFHVMELYDDTSAPFFYGVNMDSKNPIVFSRKKLVNPNGFVFGIPGSGKSMTGSKMESGSVFLTTEDDIIIIDPQMEYDDICKAYGGTYINFAPYTDNYINLFHCSLTELCSNAEEIIKEKAELTHGVIEQVLDGEMPPGIKTIIERCVKLMYQRILSLPEEKQYIPVMTDFYGEATKQLECERNRGNLIASDAAEQLVLAVERFMSGTMEIFNHPSNVDMNNRVIVFGIKDLGKSLWGMAMSIMLSCITQRVQANFKRGKTTWIYIDEFHYLTKTPFTKEYTIEAWKTFRKFNAIPTGITQNAIDLLKDPDTTTLVSNSQYTMFLKQSPNDVDVILSAFKDISEAQLQFITSAAPGTGILRYGDVVVTMDARIEKNNPIYDVFNTNPYEKAKQLQARAEKEETPERKERKEG